MYTITRPFLGALALLTFGLASSASAQSNIAPEKFAHEQAPVGENIATRTAPVVGQSLMMADTFYYESFGDGVADWTFVNVDPDSVSVWRYETDVVLANSGDARWSDFAAPSADDGFLRLDYRAWLIENNIPIAQPYPTIIGDAISPMQDWSSFDPALKYALNFFSYQPTLNVTNSTVLIRRPGVADVEIWRSLQDVFRPNVAVQTPVFVRLPEDIIGSDSIQIVLHHEGDFYGWVIDDILLTALPEIEPQTNDFIAIAPNDLTPSSQADGYELAFVADVQNNGSVTIDMDLAVTIFDAAGAMIFTDTTRYGAVETDSLRENQVFDNTFPMPTADGTYTGVYEIFTERIDEDVILANNTQTFEFTVGGNVFSKGNFASGVRPAGGDVEYAFTNLYYTPNLVADSTFQIDSVTFGMFPQGFTGDDEAFIDFKTYGFRGDLNGDNIAQYGDIDDADAELVELAAREFIIDATFTEIPNAAAITYAPSEDGSVDLAHDADFVGFGVALTYIPGAGGTNDDNVCFLGNTPNTYGGFNLAAAGAGIVDSLTSILTTDGEGTYGFFTGSSPFLQAEISYRTVSSAKETVLAESAFGVRPNPATTQFTIDFDFGVTVDAQFEIINAVGQTVSAFNRDGLSTGVITIPTQGMNNGLYYVKVRTNDGQKASRKLLLAR
ncbi:MAG: T9SS type A sorting domain-containing protein [Saprospiraceae bacterium]